MPDLFITPTRWDLLRAVDDGSVYRTWNGPLDLWDLGPGHSPRYRKVNASVRDLSRADLVFPGWASYIPAGERGLYELTVEGKRLLSEHTCVSCRGYTRTAPTCGTCRGRADD